MNSSHTLEWIAALLACWMSLTTIYQSSAGPMRCDAQHSASGPPQSPAQHQPDPDIEAMIRDMRLHD